MYWSHSLISTLADSIGFFCWLRHWPWGVQYGAWSCDIWLVDIPESRSLVILFVCIIILSQSLFELFSSLYCINYWLKYKFCANILLINKLLWSFCLKYLTKKSVRNLQKKSSKSIELGLWIDTTPVRAHDLFPSASRRERTLLSSELRSAVQLRFQAFLSPKPKPKPKPRASSRWTPRRRWRPAS
jgi:hypothetical protein